MFARYKKMNEFEINIKLGNLITVMDSAYVSAYYKGSELKVEIDFLEDLETTCEKCLLVSSIYADSYGHLNVQLLIRNDIDYDIFEKMVDRIKYGM